MNATSRTRNIREGTLAAALGLFVALAIGGCGGSGGDSAGAYPESWQTPALLPLTPVAAAYTAADPAFEALPGARALFGAYEGGIYQIEVPGDWNGDVVYFAHGFRGNSTLLTAGPPPMRAYFIEHGYAWAASSYTKNGYEPGAGARDTLALRDVFAREVRAPEREYLYGQSMGGHIVAFSLEREPDAYDGALSECGVISGREILDFFISWGTLAQYLSGVDLREALPDARTFAARMANEVVPRLGTADAPTDAGRTFASAVLHLTGGERPFFREGYAQNYGLNFSILAGAVAAPGPANAAASNAGTQYALDTGLNMDAETLNREIPRVAANEAYRDGEQYPEFANLTGEIRVPVMSIHGTGDVFVPISLEQSYRRTVDAAGNGDLLVQRAIRRPGHCNFSGEERVRAFEDLVAWVERGERPEGDDFTASLADAGRLWTTPPESTDPGGMR